MSVPKLLNGTSKSVPASVIRRFGPTTPKEVISSFVSLASPGTALPPTGCHTPESKTYNWPESVSTYVVPSAGVPVGPPFPLCVNSFVESLSPST